MLKNLFPRLFGQFREGGIIHAKFVVTNAGTPSYALKSAVGTQNYQSLSLARNGATGKCTLTLAGGCRALAVLDIKHLNISAPTDFTKQLLIGWTAAFVESGATVQFTLFQSGIAGASGAAADPVTGDEIHVTAYVDR